MFATEQHKIEFDAKIEAILAKKICVYCLMPYKRHKEKQNCLKCNKRKCIALKSNSTIFDKKPFLYTKLQFCEILDVLYLFFIGVKNKQIEILTKISKVSISKIIKNSLKLIKKFVKLDKSMIGGNDIIVEGDESLFGRKKYNRGRQRNQTWVIGFVEKTSKRKVFFCTIKKRNKKSIFNIISKKIHNESILHTDEWRGYCVASLYVKQHKTVNHSVGFINHETQVHTNTIEGTWTALKSSIPKRARSKKHLSLWLHYFMFKRNYPGDIFSNFIKILN